MRRGPIWVALLLALGCCSATAAPAARAATLPSGFHDETVFSKLEEPTTLRFAPDGRVFVAEKTGKILVYDGLEDTKPTVFADLRTDVYDTGDRGLLGLALDPDFPARPYVYALYTYDHVLGEAGKAPKWGEPDHSGDECPKPGSADVDACPVSGRLVRLTAAAGGDHAVEDGEGEVAQDVLVEGWCQQFSSHSIGDLQFDPSGALYASGGDGANANGVDYGQSGWPVKNQCGDPPAGLGGLEAPPSAEGGALRAQDARTPADPSDLGADPTDLNGSVIRIDPDSGEGWPGNPMSASLDPNERRIVGYGFRNPFRFTIDPTDGEIYVDNVGWNTYEEMDRFAVDPQHAFNSGWPCYEGPEPNPSYESLELSLCKGLYEEPGATTPPFFYYKHGASVVPGDECSPEPGAAISGIAFYEGGSFPASYDGALFFADSVRGCIYVMLPGADGRPDPLTTTAFMSEPGIYPGVDLEAGPEGDLYYVDLFGEGEGGAGSVHRISYDADAPVARLVATPPFGAAPLHVNLDASGSTDPNGEALSYEWDLDGNGSFETAGAAARALTFGGTENVTVAVRVSDSAGSSVARETVYPGDTPPEPAIAEPSEALNWRVGQQIHFSGSAEDNEDGQLGASALYWKTRLYHCPSACHVHPLQVFPAVEEGSFVAPDHDYPSHLEISLTATDSRGLSATETVSVYPRTVNLAIQSDPPGLQMGAGLLLGATPFALTAIEGADIVLSAPTTASLGGRTYTWTRWSDAGERVHTIVAGAIPSAYTAEYTASEGSSGEAEMPSIVSSGGTPGLSPLPPAPAPSTLLSGHPPRRTRARSARFIFSSGDLGTAFRCKLDRRSFEGCESPRVYRHLQLGPHTFEVVAGAGSGAPAALPKRFGWRVLGRSVPRGERRSG